MSSVTAFNFRAFECDLDRDKQLTKKAVSLSAMTPDDLQRLPVVEIRTPLGREHKATPWAPVSHRGGGEEATFWDPRMGNFDMKSLPTQSCTTCKDSNQRAMRVNERCGGHYGYVSMPRIGREGQMVVFNPLLFKDLMTLLRSQCFVCMAFRVPEYDALRWELAFTLFDAGLVGEALGFLSTFKPLRGATTFSAATSTAAASPGAAVATKSKGKRQREAEEAEDNAAEGAVIIEDLDHDDGTGMKQYTGLTGLKKYVRHRFRACKARGDLPANDAERLRILHCVVDVRNNLVQTALREFADYPKACSRCHAESPAFSEKDGQVFIKYSARTMERLVALNKVEESVRQEWLAEMRIMKRQRIALQAAVAMTHMKALCERHSALLASLLHNLGEATVPIPFNEALPAEKLFRPFFLDRILVPPVSARIAAGARIKDGSLQADERTTTLNDALKFVLEIENYYAMKEAGHEVTDRQYNANESNIRNLQLNVNKAYDEVLGSFAKKEGLFRMHMMGKRVNQACRSVISPDFTVEPNEILLPRPFARNLSYPERVVFYDPGRAALLKQCVKNGPAVYPGATHIELRKPSGAVESVDLSAQGEEGRGRIADAHFEMAKNGREVYVYRHVLDGDRVVFNRQPTLHRPSMQSYEAKVLSSLRTIRFHYVNGKSYNADFDGDEMNVHVPQSLECRSELDVIMDANMNFLAPTSGRPIRGLIQDHCIAGVLLTVRDRFFDREQFTQLVYSGLQPYLKSSHDLTTFIPIPAILKPVPMWTGKQVITAALRFLTGVNPANPGEGANVGVSCKGASQSYQSKWSTHDGSRVADHDLPDDPVLIRDSELLVGVLDKAQLGPTHLAVPHALFDVYGPHVAGKFFGAIGRILTYALRYDGLSLGVEDMLLTDKQGLHDALREIDLCALDMDDEGATIGLLNKKASVVHGDQLPTKLRVPFPKNDLVTMTTTGAKGSSTNAIQMAVMLGQQTFDGQRIKPMSSHKTMPSFFPGERRARSFGFAMGRFVSGIRPAEYTIHAMAGREGLIDTAVKTARSGYLQRCLVKGLESLTVHWDGTVRDSNGSVVQFKFGGDGLDPCRASTAKQWDVIHRNMADLQRRYETGAFAPRPTVPEDPEEEDSMDEDAAAGPGQKWQTSMRDREMNSELPAHIADSLKRANLEPTLKPRTVQRWDRKGQKFDRIQQAKQELKSVVSDITKARLTRSMCEPGEAVGIVAAQAAGEPSTQMTLNTFHQAGATVTHVTEGIPRLRELLMYASVAKAAVIVPVKSLNNGELDVIRRIHDRVKPTPVAQLCAQVRRQFQWGVTRADGKATVRLAVLLSKPALDQHRRALGIGKADHVVLISSALKQLGKNICAQLRGRTDPNAAGGGGGGVTRQAVLDPTALLPEEEEHDAVARTMSAMDNDADDLADVSRRVNSDSDDDDEDEDDDKSVASEKAAADSDDDDDAEVPVAKDDESSAAEDDIPFAERFSTKKAAPKRSAKSSGADASVMTYDQFPAVDCTCVKNTMHLQVWPAKVGSVMDVTKASAELVDNIVVAQVKIVMPSDVIAVVPDVVKSCLASTMVRGKGPQVEKVQWIPDANGQKGELVFQGEGASLKTAMALLAPYVDVHTGIDLRNITSTDVRDLAETFGIEAAYQALLKELSKLFARHSVDERHLSLMSDVATHRGIWQAFNYNGMISQSSSPLFQMTFASSRKFLEKAISRGVPDDLNSFSAAIMVGERPKVGTATVGVAAEPEVVKDVISERAASKLKPMPAPPAFTL